MSGHPLLYNGGYGSAASPPPPANGGWQPGPPEVAQQPAYGYQAPYQATFSNAANVLSNPLVAQIGAQYVTQGQAFVAHGVTPLKKYFNVSNAFVAAKLRLLLFPFAHASWSRLVARSESSVVDEHRPPREDINAPDMYIPAMAFVTYVLLVAIQRGADRQFHPEVLGLTSTTALTVAALEVLRAWLPLLIDMKENLYQNQLSSLVATSSQSQQQSPGSTSAPLLATSLSPSLSP